MMIGNVPPRRKNSAGNPVTMNINHVAIWTQNIDAVKNFFTRYFHCVATKKYRNRSRRFESYFLSFESGAQLELMHVPELKNNARGENSTGLAHIAISVGSRNKVIELTEQFRNDGYTVLSPPRTTGDGFFESLILDPEGNEIELTV